MFWAEIWKISEFLSENFQFLVVKFSIYLNRRVFVMLFSGCCQTGLLLNEVHKNLFRTCKSECLEVKTSYWSDLSSTCQQLQEKTFTKISKHINLTLVMLNKLRCHTYFQFSANQITWSRLLIQIHILNGKQCRSRSDGFWSSQLICIYTVCKGRVYLGSAGQRLTQEAHGPRFAHLSDKATADMQMFPIIYAKIQP